MNRVCSFATLSILYLVILLDTLYDFFDNIEFVVEIHFIWTD
jgi:hypothetical protein